VLHFKGPSYRTRHLRGQGVPIVSGKMAAEFQERTNAEREKRIKRAVSLSEEREKAPLNCLSIEAQRMLEAQAAAAYWQAFEGIPLSWVKAKKVPVNWLAIGSRTSPKSGGPRKAVDPFNACLNYLYAVLESRVKRACLMAGIDPDFGIIHADHQQRASLVFDLMEPVRPEVDRLLFDWFTKRTLHPKDFFETREGVCKVSPNVAAEIIPLVSKLDSPVSRTVKEFASFFKNKWVEVSPEEFARRKVSFRQMRINFAQAQKEERGSERLTIAIAGKPASICCLECGQTFTPQRPSQKFCCNRHKETYRKRLLREKRKAEGKCPQCGRPMAEGAKGTYKDKVSYCEHCQEYWKKKHKKTMLIPASSLSEY